MAKLPQPARDSSSTKFVGCAVVLVIFAGVVLSRCTSLAPSTKIAEVHASDSAVAIDTRVASEAPIAEAVLIASATHAGKALGADGVDGAEAYSVNCWAALERTFTLNTADRCAAFDAMILGEGGSDESGDLTWFAEDAVAQRYKLAVGNRQPSLLDAGARLERLRVAAAVRRVVLIVPKVKPQPEADDDGEASSEADATASGDNSFGTVQ